MEAARHREAERAHEERRRWLEAHQGHCPTCGSRLERITLGGETADRCPSCLGVWLDHGRGEDADRQRVTSLQSPKAGGGGPRGPPTRGVTPAAPPLPALVRAQLSVEVSARRVLSVTVPHFTASGLDEAPPYSLLDAPPELDLFTEAFRRYFPTVLELAEAEHLVRQFIRHIERTRRRVNALEYVLIPAIEDGVRSIQSKLNEMERANTSRLMLIKKMLEARE